MSCIRKVYLVLKFTGRIFLAFCFQVKYNRISRIKKVVSLLVRRHKQFKRFVKNDQIIDVLIPALDVDLMTLPFCINELRKNLLHPIGNIMIVSRNSEKKLIDFCHSHQCKFIDEKEVLPFSLNYINLKVNGVDRSGWILQQLLKLSADRLTDKKYCPLMDADTMLIRPQAFIINGKDVVSCSDEYHLPYFSAYQRVTGKKEIFPLSFTCHHTFLNIEKLKKIKVQIESNTKMKWYDGILNNIDRNEMSAFCEHETYGNFVVTNYPHETEICYWFNKSLSRKHLGNIDKLIKQYSFLYKSISMHSYYTD